MILDKTSNYLDSRKISEKVLPVESAFEIENNGEIYTITTDSKSKVVDILKNSTGNKLTGIVKQNFAYKIENFGFDLKNIEYINYKKNKDYKIEVSKQEEYEDNFSKQEEFNYDEQYELFYDDSNFDDLRKELLVKLEEYFSKRNLFEKNFSLWNNEDLTRIFSSKNISERNKEKFGKEIVNIIKKNIFKGYTVNAYGRTKLGSKINLIKEKFLFKKKVLNDPVYIEEKLDELSLLDFRKYFSKDKIKFSFLQKAKKYFF